MGLFALANSFTMRVCLSMTITQMVLHAQSTEHIIGETCPAVSSRTASTNTTANDTIVDAVSHIPHSKHAIGMIMKKNRPTISLSIQIT